MICRTVDCSAEVPPARGPGQQKLYCSSVCRRRSRRDADRARLRRYRAANPDATAEYAATYRERHPLKIAARNAVNNAVMSGRLKRGPCEVGEGCQGRIEAHHEDYEKQLDVRWLCVRHHAAAEANALTEGGE